MSIQDLI